MIFLGMKGISVVNGRYHKIKAEGETPQLAVFNAWQKVWNSGIDRTYKTDFELYEATEVPGVFDISVLVGIE